MILTRQEMLNNVKQRVGNTHWARWFQNLVENDTISHTDLEMAYFSALCMPHIEEQPNEFFLS